VGTSYWGVNIPCLFLFLSFFLCLVRRDGWEGAVERADEGYKSVCTYVERKRMRMREERERRDRYGMPSLTQKEKKKNYLAE
jgi:hypothetical protein